MVISKEGVEGFLVSLWWKTVGMGQVNKGLGGSGVEIEKFQ